MSAYRQLHEQLRPRVAAGAKFLDRIDPELLRQIDVEALNLGDDCRCILGQLGHIVAADDCDEDIEFCSFIANRGDEMIERQEALDGRYYQLVMTHDDARKLGFDIDRELTTNSGHVYQVLTELWAEAIEARRAR